jgi:hypothetical protein
MLFIFLCSLFFYVNLEAVSYLNQTHALTGIKAGGEQRRVVCLPPGQADDLHGIPIFKG